MRKMVTDYYWILSSQRRKRILQEESLSAEEQSFNFR